MKLKGITACCIIVAAFIGTDSRAQATLSLKESVETGLKNNLDIKQTQLAADIAAVGYQQAKANLLPDLNGNFSYGFNQGRSIDPFTNDYINQKLSSSNVGLSSGVILFNGLSLQNTIRQNKYAYEAGQMDYQQAKDNLTLNIILAYLSVLSNEDVLAVTEGQLAVTRKQVERMEILVKEGSVGNYQLTDLRGQQATDEISIISARNAVQSSKLALSQLMNVPYDRDLKLDRTDIEMPLEKYGNSSAELYQAAMQNFAAVKANDFRIKSAEKRIMATRGNYYPRIALNANLGSNYSSAAATATALNSVEVQTGNYVFVNSTKVPVLALQQNYAMNKIGYSTQLGNNVGTFAGISMQVPLFNNFFNRNQVKLAKINLKSSQVSADITKLQLRQSIEQAWQNMDASFERYKALTGQVANFEESFRAAEIRFNTGVINATEFLLTKNNLDRAKINHAQAKYEYILRTKVLDFYQAKLAY